jgi:3,4-dihydroxy 2-butanone 4-phosphate synthase
MQGYQCEKIKALTKDYPTNKLVDTYLLVKSGSMIMSSESTDKTENSKLDTGSWTLGTGLRTAIEKLRQGSMVAIYDGDEREGEVDLVFHASFATPEKIERLRKDGGGLICLSLDAESAKRLKLPFYTDILRESSYEVSKMECCKTAYKDKPAFAIAVNSKHVYTGITDEDRALTIKSIAQLIDKVGEIHNEFMEEFYSPGHIFLLIGRGIENRKGHTELTLELARRAGLSGAMVLCEMLGPGKALQKDEAKGYAKKNGFAFIEGRELW